LRGEHGDQGKKKKGTPWHLLQQGILEKNRAGGSRTVPFKRTRREVKNGIEGKTRRRGVPLVRGVHEEGKKREIGALLLTLREMGGTEGMFFETQQGKEQKKNAQVIVEVGKK